MEQATPKKYLKKNIKKLKTDGTLTVSHGTLAYRGTLDENHCTRQTDICKMK